MFGLSEHIVTVIRNRVKALRNIVKVTVIRKEAPLFAVDPW